LCRRYGRRVAAVVSVVLRVGKADAVLISIDNSKPGPRSGLYRRGRAIVNDVTGLPTRR